ncbi:MAG: GAF domain-containing protein [Deltaproteobacteria bacterium]|nr:GAF domain-containing protein [Deltaproteobacteria bacterium]
MKGFESLDNFTLKHFKIVVFILIAFFLAVSVTSLIKAASWIDKPFPGFLLYRNSIICEVSLSHWTGNHAGLVESYDKVVGVDGISVSPADIYSIVSSKPVGTSVNYSVSRNGELIRVSVPTMNFGAFDFLSVFGWVYLVGLVIFIAGMVVYFFKPDLESSKLFFMFCFSMGIWFTSIFDTQSTYSLGNVPFMGWMFTPAFGIALGFVFPSRRKFLTDNSFIMPVPFLLSFLIFILHLIYFDAQYLWKIVDISTWIYVLASSLLFISTAAISYLRPDSSLDKERSKVILLGAFLGFFLPALCAMAITALDVSNLNALAILVTFFPLSVAYAIVKHKLFDIDVIIQKALVYGVLTGALVCFFASMVLAFNLAFANYGGWRNPAFFVLLTTFLVFTLNPLRNRIQNFIDLTFFRKEYDYRRTVEEISFAMISLLNLDEITDKIISTIVQTMFSNPVSVILFDQNSGDYEVYAKSRGAHSLMVFSIKEDNELIKLLSRYRQEIFKDDLIADERYIRYRSKLMKTFDDFNAALFVPILFKKRLIGILSLGDKKSGLSYNSQDIKLLRILANQSAIAIENAFAFRLVEDYAKKLEEANREIRETQSQLIQIEKMSAIGQLAAGIAHEIRNPLNIIEGARYYLSQMIDGENSVVVKEYLDYIKHEIDRTNRLIDNLLKFSRSEPPHFEPVNVNGILENALVLIRKQISDSNIKLITTFHPQIPGVMGDPNQLWQVFINILINAIQAMPQGGELQIDTGVYNVFSNNIFISFRDTGGGIDEEDISKIFDPFFTRKETGTGLGLSISYKIVENHNGRIIVASKKGEGTTFVIELCTNQDIKGVDDEREQKDIGG